MEGLKMENLRMLRSSTGTGYRRNGHEVCATKESAITRSCAQDARNNFTSDIVE